MAGTSLPATGSVPSIFGRPSFCAIDKVRGRDDAGDALRSGSDHAGAFSKVVMAQGLGDEDRQTPRNEEGCSMGLPVPVQLARISNIPTLCPLIRNARSTSLAQLTIINCHCGGDR